MQAERRAAAAAGAASLETAAEAEAKLGAAAAELAATGRQLAEAGLREQAAAEKLAAAEVTIITLEHRVQLSESLGSQEREELQAVRPARNSKSARQLTQNT